MALTEWYSARLDARLGARAPFARLVERTKCTVAEMLEYWMETEIVPNRRPTTSDRYRYAIDGHLNPGLGSIQIQSLTASQVQRFSSQ
jgi:Phage integrase, N-terminal SAM-like domain